MSLNWRFLPRREVAMDRLAAMYRNEPPRTLAERVRVRLAQAVAWIRGGHWPS